MEGCVAFEYLEEVLSGFLFRQPALEFEHFGEIAAGTVLSDDIAVVGSKEGVEVGENVGMLDIPKAVDFGLQHQTGGVVSEGPQFDDLDGYFLFCVKRGVRVRSSVPL